MHGYYDFFLVAILAFSGIYSLISKNLVGKAKERYYTKESIQKFSIIAGILDLIAAVIALVYALGNHGIIGFKMNQWLYYIVLLLIIVLGVFVAEKMILKKTDEFEAKDSLKNGGDEDF